MGLNYTGTKHALGGCINDAKNIKNLLQEKFNYRSNNITIMTDDTPNILYPNKKNILQQLQSLVDKVINENLTEIWISYSGHGSTSLDKNTDEIDKRDESICPLDMYTNGFITDDIINNFLKEIPSSCKVICFFDSCHSGTICDLNYKYSFRKNTNDTNDTNDANDTNDTNHTNNTNLNNKNHNNKMLWNQNKINNNLEITCPIISISGCHDSQEGSDIYDRKTGIWGGSLTNAFIKIVQGSNTNITCKNLCKKLNIIMKKNNLTQRPILCSSHFLDESVYFFNNDTLLPHNQSIFKIYRLLID